MVLQHLRLQKKRYEKGDIETNNLLADVLQDMTSVRKIKEVAKILKLDVGCGTIKFTSHFQLISPPEGLSLPATDREEIPDSIFDGYFDPQLNDPAVRGKNLPCPSTKSFVYEMNEDGMYKDLFGSFGKDKEQLSWTWNQVKLFVVHYRNWLRQDGWATFFRLESGFVAYVYVDDDGRLDVLVSRFDFSHVWNAENRHRLVAPQQAVTQ